MLFLSVTEVHLIRCQRQPAIAISFPGAKPALTCVFGPAFDPRIAGTQLRASVTSTSDEPDDASPRAPKIAVELELFLRRAGRSVMPAARVIHGLVTSGRSDSTARAVSAGRFGLLSRTSPVGQRARCDRDGSVAKRVALGRRMR